MCGEKRVSLNLSLTHMRGVGFILNPSKGGCKSPQAGHSSTQAAGGPRQILSKPDAFIRLCPRCSQFKPPLHRPTLKTKFALYFNHQVQCDAFVLWGKQFLLFIDVLFKYKQAGLINSETFDEMSRVFMSCWIRFFVPPTELVLDAGPLNSSLELGMMCDRFGIKRVLAASALDGKHTLTGDAERHIALLKGNDAQDACRHCRSWTAS